MMPFSIQLQLASRHLQHLLVDDVGRAPRSVLWNGESELVKVTDSRRGHIELAVPEYWLIQQNGHTLQCLSLGLIDGDRERWPDRELPPFPLERELAVRRTEG